MITLNKSIIRLCSFLQEQGHQVEKMEGAVQGHTEPNSTEKEGRCWSKEALKTRLIASTPIYQAPIRHLFLSPLTINHLAFENPEKIAALDLICRARGWEAWGCFVNLCFLFDICDQIVLEHWPLLAQTHSSVFSRGWPFCPVLSDWAESLHLRAMASLRTWGNFGKTVSHLAIEPVAIRPHDAHRGDRFR